MFVLIRCVCLCLWLCGFYCLYLVVLLGLFGCFVLFSVWVFDFVFGVNLDAASIAVFVCAC